MLGSLLKAVQETLGGADNTVQVVSVYGGCGHVSSPVLTPTMPQDTTQPTSGTPESSTCVWVSAKEADDRFIELVKLQGLLALHTRQVVQHL